MIDGEAENAGDEAEDLSQVGPVRGEFYVAAFELRSEPANNAVAQMGEDALEEAFQRQNGSLEKVLQELGGLNDRGPEAQKAFDALYGIGPVTASKLMDKGSYTDINVLVKDLKLPEDSPSRWAEKAPPTVSLTGEIEWE